MTLEPYTPDRLDELALRVLDVCGQLRGMARRARDERLQEFALHDKKALEWLAHLEEWAHKSGADFELTLVRNRGTQRAIKAAKKG
jgi:hypothetical protein